MLKVRSNVFETNSSSVHSIVIDVSGEPKPMDTSFTSKGGEYGWGYDKLLDVVERTSYLWQAVWDMADGKGGYGTRDEWRERIARWVPNATLEDIEDGRQDDGDDNWYYPGIDHCGELIPMLKQFYVDDRLLGAYLVGGASHVICSNDNSDSYDFHYPDVPFIEYRKGN